MNNKSSIVKRLVFLCVLLVLAVSLCGISLFDLQIINAEEYYQKSQRKSARSVTEHAARGEILDRYGRQLVTNEMGFSIMFDYYLMEKETQNEKILNLIGICQKYAVAYQDTMPISKTIPFEYMSDNKGNNMPPELIKFCELNKWDTNLSAHSLIVKLIEKYDIDISLDEKAQRNIAAVRYEMEKTQFSPYNSFIFAQSVPIDMVAWIKEHNRQYTGVLIDITTNRSYQTTYAAHILGRTGPIYKEEYESLKKQGYKMDAIIGKDGAEKSFEQYLKGQDGKKSIETNISGNTTGSSVIQETISGNNVVLTIDLKLQQEVEKSLATRIPEIRSNAKSGKKKQGKNAKGASAVVLDVNSGEILALASYPTYNLESFNKDYKSLVSDTLKPMFNRAIAGTYQPGSTYKIITSVAALSEGVITRKTIIKDLGIYKFYEDYRPRCWLYKETGRTHGSINISGALKGSCNYFYYEVGRLLGGEKMEKYAHALGLGEYTGIELEGEKKGNVAGPTSRQEKGLKWEGGDALQAAIGQSDHAFSPLALAGCVATVINGGTRYNAHILKEVKSYDYNNTVVKNQPQVLSTVDISPENLDSIKKGMNDVVNEGGTAASIFRNYPMQIGGKSGSAQTGKAREDAHGVFVAFAPYENPEIVICVFGENAGSGSNVAPIVRDILNAYFFSHGQEDKIMPNYTIIP